MSLALSFACPALHNGQHFGGHAGLGLGQRLARAARLSWIAGLVVVTSAAAHPPAMPAAAHIDPRIAPTGIPDALMPWLAATDRWHSEACHTRPCPPLTRTLLTSPLQAPYRMGTLVAQLSQHAPHAAKTAAIVAALGGAEAWPAFAPTTAPDDDPGGGRSLAEPTGEPLADAIGALAIAHPRNRSEARGPDAATRLSIDTLRSRAPALANALARFIHRLVLIEQLRIDALGIRRTGANGHAERTDNMTSRPAGTATLPERLNERQRNRIAAALQHALMAMAALRDALAERSPSAHLPDITLDTALGPILVHASHDDSTFSGCAPLLLIDIGGSDRYRFDRSTDCDPPSPLRFLLDLGGNDHYETTADFAGPSSAQGGIGVLWDVGGHDHYLGNRHDQAAAQAGAAALIDEAGDDRYEATAFAQAHAQSGLALLIDRAGNDDYLARHLAQGAGQPEGVALLLDLAGNDRYRLANTPRVAPSAQSPAHNASLGQGCGVGRRDDLGAGDSQPGGTGLLADLAGDDQYDAQVFAQGCGYWLGTGLWYDGGGTDTVRSHWYALGAAAHRGAGIAVAAGTDNDDYLVTASTALGTGHDGAVGVFIDDGGNDRYTLARLGLGAGSANGFGLFVDKAGDDDYTHTQPGCLALGAAPMERWGDGGETQANIGAFADLGGNDRYPAGCAQAGNDRHWQWPRTWPEQALPSEIGHGVDTASAATLFPTAPLTAAPASRATGDER